MARPFSRAVLVRVDPRDAERAPVGVVLGVVVVAGDERLARVVGVEVGVHRRVEAAVGARQEPVDEAAHELRGREPARRRRVSAYAVGVVVDRARLERHQLLEVRVQPVAVGRVLADAAPHGVDDRCAARSSVKSARSRASRRPPRARRAPTRCPRRAAPSAACPSRPASASQYSSSSCCGPRRATPASSSSSRGARLQRRASAPAASAPAGRPRRPPRAGSRANCSGGRYPLNLPSSCAVGRHEHRRRPSPLAVALLEVGARVDVDLHRDEARVEELAHLRVVVRRRLHHVAPVAPLGAAIDDHEALLVARAGEGRRRSSSAHPIGAGAVAAAGVAGAAATDGRPHASISKSTAAAAAGRNARRDCARSHRARLRARHPAGFAARLRHCHRIVAHVGRSGGPRSRPRRPRRTR